MKPIKIKIKKKKNKWVITLSVLFAGFVLTGIGLGYKSYAKKKMNTNCSFFRTQAEAQLQFNIDPVKYKNLDANRDGIACNALLKK